ncbi:MAG: tetratricopeptide repeat protein [Bdellovibrionaceae bacterium]|nr:tetratricopeptide repeat protein [Pseudobdellovibrionaceae bacterium]MBC7456996.1 tetratricopeptide repeat protein [Pseudobdellovibrionaceae bacterium]
MMVRLILTLSALCMMSSCLKTRADLADEEQSQVYGKKSGDNQIATARPSQLSAKAQPAVVDDRDESIRAFNGRIESLENQINNLQKEKEKAASTNTAEAQKNQALQETLAKMEAQLQKLEAEAAGQKAAAAVGANHAVTGSDANTIKASGAPVPKTDKSKKEAAHGADYELAQGHFAKKEWKKAILVYQKYVDEAPKGPNVADSKYKIGVCFQELGMKEEAMAFYEEVIANFGKTEQGKKAKIRLAKLKK